MPKVADVVILGAGPAAWSVAAALAPHGLSVTLVAPNPTSTWENTYGIWTDQLNAEVRTLFPSDEPFRETFDTVYAIGNRRQTVKRSYGLLNNETVGDALRTKAASGSLTTINGQATAIDHEANGSNITLADGTNLRGTVVLDGTGATSSFVKRENQTAPAFQVAYGVIADFAEPPLEPNACVHMDWRGPDVAVPSFAYTMPIDGHWLVEETSLASRPAMTFDELERRLHARLAAAELKIIRTHRVERVLFPMNTPLPDRGQRTIGLGAAASIVHPATGYSVAASLRLAPRLAAAIAQTLGASGANPDSVARSAWKRIWPSDRVKARGLESYGLERVLTMNQGESREFFDAFFSLDLATSSTYLSGEAGSGEMASVMWKVFRKVSPGLQRRLATGNPLSLARTLLR